MTINNVNTVQPRDITHTKMSINDNNLLLLLKSWCTSITTHCLTIAKKKQKKNKRFESGLQNVCHPHFNIIDAHSLSENHTVWEAAQ